METASPSAEGNAARGRTAVLGLGNPILSDDGVGLVVAQELRRLLGRRPIPGVEVLDSSRGGFDLIELLQGYARAILVDSLDLPDPRPGRIRQLTLRDVSGCARLIGAHEITIGAAFQLAERLGIPMPCQVRIFGIEGRDIHTLGEGLTPSVRAAARPLAQHLHATLLAEAPPAVPLDSRPCEPSYEKGAP
jgi:hydrogenase maturation protease